jgi:predicted RNA-binding protein YlxR (DUF448 family)
MSATRHIPVRSCVGCGRRVAQSDLVRFVATASGDLRPDAGPRQPGRGAYIHPVDACQTAFVSRKPPLRSLRRSVDRARREALVAALRQVER